MKKSSSLRLTAMTLALLAPLATAYAATDNPHQAVDYPSQIGPSGMATHSDADAATAEASKRAALKHQPLTAGATVVEPGYYRAVGSHGKTGRSVTLLSAGAKAPTQKQLGERGKYFAPERWEWVADAQSVTRANVGSACPKSGEWHADVPVDVPNYKHFQDVVVTCDLGSSLPRLNIGDPYDDARVRWVWIGPAGDQKHASQ
ncbi:hypothetical protein [Dyella subtropica]|uniref:hypothetical protein n=1 Tax=Dyella subtropica TaxID=2992127 RepID=UPI002256ECF0|nr:hypothetical protein [Dyella subtropica]